MFKQLSAVLIIAEIGVNHNGDLQVAKEMVREAARCGANAVKFQTFSASRVVRAGVPMAHYQRLNIGEDISQEKMLQSLELPVVHYSELIDLCSSLGIMFTTTPYNPEDFRDLKAFDLPFVKLASMHIVEPQMLEAAADFGKPILMSSGMASLEEIDYAVNFLHSRNIDEIAILQCTTSYPAETSDANLRVIANLASRYQFPVGFSDHTTSLNSAIAATALGAKILEKHFTLNKYQSGPDHSCSADPFEFGAYVNAVRETEIALGCSSKYPSDIERINLLSMRRSLCVNKQLEMGSLITRDDLIAKRPLDGIPASNFFEIIGRKLNRNIDPGDVLKWEYLDVEK